MLRSQIRPVALVTLLTFLFSLVPSHAWAQLREPAPRMVPQSESAPIPTTGAGTTPTAADTAAAAAPGNPAAATATSSATADTAAPSKSPSPAPTDTAAPAGASGAPGKTTAKDPAAEAAAKKARDAIPELDKSLQTKQLALPTGADKSGVSSKSVSLPKGAGSIKGMEESFSAQLSTGIATFSVPFALPAARGGVSPSLGLSYSSAGGHGVAGVGWSFGVPFIARQSDKGVPNYNDGPTYSPTQDKFVFNGGQELVPICVVGADGGCPGALKDQNSGDPENTAKLSEVMPGWAGGWMYFRARVEGSFLRFFWSSDHRTWRVQDKSGTGMELGVPLDGSGDTAALETNPDKASEIYRWSLVRQYDNRGAVQQANPVPNNFVLYKYVQDGGTTYLSDIYDTSPAAQPSSTALAGFAHHTHLVYETRPDPTHSYRSGWRMDQRWRLTGVDVTSKPFGDNGSDTQSPRQLVRRYHLGYDAKTHVSLLTSVQVEGRCQDAGKDAATENGQGQLPPTTGCGVLPAMTFDYSHVAGYSPGGSPDTVPLSDGQGKSYELFDGRVNSATKSPDHSLDEALTTLFDINSDGLPDVLVTAPGLYGNGHGVFFNGKGGLAPAFGDVQTMMVQGVTGVDAGVLKLSNLNVTPLDADGDGVVDLLHMPIVKTYNVFTPQKSGNNWLWQGRSITTAGDQNPKIDFGKDTLDIQVMDANFDGLVDVVFTAGTEVQTFFSQGRLPQGDGQFGQGTRTGVSTADIQHEPVRMCVPWSATPIHFSDPDIKVADMNGDGIPDIVRLRKGAVVYWPGRGNGLWGTGKRDDCPKGTFGSERHVTMTTSPQFTDIQQSGLKLDDVNGDGLSDLVQIDFDSISVWLNVDGSGWTDRKILKGTPAAPSYQDRVRLADINGSGTRDIVWGDGQNYRYLDLQGGQQPWLLSKVNNGLGKSTELEFSTSTQEMLAAEAKGPCNAATPWTGAWCSKMPVVTHVVKRVKERDNLNVAAISPGVYTTEYSYRDPVYEGRQREFRGFARARATRIGDANSPTDITETTFLLGECVSPAGSTTDYCSPPYRYLDNPREALKGLPLTTERFDAGGTYLATTHNGYVLRELYVGLDGRRVMHAHQTQTNGWGYDTTLPAQAAAATGLTTVSFDRVSGGNPSDNPLLPSPGTLITSQVPVHGSNGVAHTQSATSVDSFGNAYSSIASGCLAGGACAASDEAITSISAPELLPDGSGWLWRTRSQWVTGAAHSEQRHKTRTTYDGYGTPIKSEALLAGSLPVVREFATNLARNAELANSAPMGASADSWIKVSETKIDPNLGVPTRSLGANGRCADVAYDLGYSQLGLKETVYTGGCAALDAQGLGTALSTTVTKYDRGLGLVVSGLDMQSQPTLASYDQFGRMTSLTAPSPTGGLSSQPSVKIDYDLANSSRPYSILHTQTLNGQTQDAQGVLTDDYVSAYAYVDGFGRTLVTLTEADPSNGDGGQWIVSSFLEYDAKSAVRRKFLNSFWNGDGRSFPINAAPKARYGSQRYDAFGRQVQTYDIDGTVTLQSRYHALCTDAFDAADLNPGPHQGTYASACKDGHGRGLKATERIHGTSGLEERNVISTYLPTGEVESITRQLGNATDKRVTRWMRYDTLGRMVLNVDPHTTQGFNASPSTDPSSMKAWRYAYNDAGDLVGTSDARGCGTNYYYDGAGRLKGEDYVPCESHHAAYTPYTEGTTAGLEVIYLYDTPQTSPTEPWLAHPQGWDSAYTKGRPIATLDRGAARWIQRDGRGRVTDLYTRIALPGATTWANRFAQRPYHQDTSYDIADRPISASTGATAPQLLGPDGKSRVTVSYTRRGTVQKVTSSYSYGNATTTNSADLVSSVLRDADGLVSQVVYGDAAKTTTVKDYDDRRRVRHVMTYRGAPASWTGAPLASYIPAPSASAFTTQLLLQDEDYVYDNVGNPTEVRDFRIPEEWPAGAKPVNKKVEYDDLYRVKKVTYEYSGGDDTWTSPFAAENSSTATPDPKKPTPSPQVSFQNRVRWQTFDYDWLGNNAKTDDDVQGFYDRSLGTTTAGDATKPYQVTKAIQPGGTRAGSLRAQYDVAGNQTNLDVNRAGPCLSVSGAICSQRYLYQWDEVGRLARARRWDQATDLASAWINPATPPTGPPAADLTYIYDASDNRVVKTATAYPPDGPAVQRHTVYVFGSLELRRATLDGSTGDYVDDETTETVYLQAHGVRLARVVSDPGAPTLQSDGTQLGKQHVFFELGDSLGSTAVVLDKETGELVERSTYQAYGAAESDYRPDRWKNFREDYRFTGKEEDIEVGLMYFGKRYLNAQLGRWVSADPLAVHAPGQADLNLYAYVKGAVLKSVDPVGLDTGDMFDNLMRGIVDTVRRAVGEAKLSALSEKKIFPLIERKSSQVDAKWAKAGSVHTGRYKAVVLHFTEGTKQSTFNLYGTRQTAGNKGAHFLIDKSGKIYQTARLDRWTNHVGPTVSRCWMEHSCKTESVSLEHKKAYPARYPKSWESVGIELESVYNPRTKKWDPITSAQRKALAGLGGVPDNSWIISIPYQQSCKET